MSNYRKKIMSLVLTSGKFLEALGSGIGTGLVFYLSFSVSNNLYQIAKEIRFQSQLQLKTPSKLILFSK